MECRPLMFWCASAAQPVARLSYTKNRFKNLAVTNEGLYSIRNEKSCCPDFARATISPHPPSAAARARSQLQVLDNLQTGFDDAQNGDALAPKARSSFALLVRSREARQRPQDDISLLRGASRIAERLP